MVRPPARRLPTLSRSLPPLQGTTAEDDPYAAHLRIQLLPDSATAITAQVGWRACMQRRVLLTAAAGAAAAAQGGVHLAPRRSSHSPLLACPAACHQEGALASRTPQRTPQRGRSSYWASRTAVQLAPTQVDCLDAVGLQYHVGWPLSAVVTEVRPVWPRGGLCWAGFGARNRLRLCPCCWPCSSGPPARPPPHRPPPPLSCTTLPPSRILWRAMRLCSA